MPSSGSSSPMAFHAEGMKAQSPATLISTRGCSSIASRIGFLPTRWRITSSPSRTNWVGTTTGTSRPLPAATRWPKPWLDDEVAPLVLAEAAVNLCDVHAPSLSGRQGGCPASARRCHRWQDDPMARRLHLAHDREMPGARSGASRGESAATSSACSSWRRPMIDSPADGSTSIPSERRSRRRP